MAHLIDKDALVAEIERRLHFDNNWIEGDKRRQIHTNSVSSAYYKRIGSKHACESILDFINTIEVKEVDLDSNIRTYLTNHFNIYEDGVLQSKESELPLSTYDIIKVAKHFFELGLLKAQKGE